MNVKVDIISSKLRHAKVDLKTQTWDVYIDGSLSLTGVMGGLMIVGVMRSVIGDSFTESVPSDITSSRLLSLRWRWSRLSSDSWRWVCIVSAWRLIFCHSCCYGNKYRSSIQHWTWCDTIHYSIVYRVYASRGTTEMSFSWPWPLTFKNCCCSTNESCTGLLLFKLLLSFRICQK